MKVKEPCIKNKCIICALVIGISIGIVIAPLFLIFASKNMQNREEAYLKRLEICLPYRKDASNYVWRHEFCENAEKEYLELFKKNWEIKNE